MSVSQDDTRVIYKPKDSREEFFVFGNPDQVLKWRKDKSIPIAEVVQSFDVFEIVNGGNEGIAGRASKQRLENAFGTSNNMEVIEYILQHGNFHKAHKGHEKSSDKKHRTMINESRGKGISTSANNTGIHN
ncbi:16187_t:CDS:2 [Funneliformis geosporum]|uniref:9958_t:CDS:1 n=1 Tax=Funneliformis geosporum TaxID=1117311 RepID=A0A9W4SZI6_9GLOM|nr:9958_t:CDS:2 [Funneliformis geosporum]CAI2187312.1 16187_t:CDS:2 [Funneliformis geosporum]